MTLNQWVLGSSPRWRTNKKTKSHFCGFVFLLFMYIWTRTLGGHEPLIKQLIIVFRWVVWVGYQNAKHLGRRTRQMRSICVVPDGAPEKRHLWMSFFSYICLAASYKLRSLRKLWIDFVNVCFWKQIYHNWNRKVSSLLLRSKIITLNYFTNIKNCIYHEHESKKK